MIHGAIKTIYIYYFSGFNIRNYVEEEIYYSYQVLEDVNLNIGTVDFEYWKRLQEIYKCLKYTL